MYIQSPGIVGTVYSSISRIFRHIQGKETKQASLSFFVIQEKCPDFGKKGPNYVHHWVKFSIQNEM